MSEFTHKIPDAKAFLHTLRGFLTAKGHDDISTLLLGGTCIISPSGGYGSRWNALATTVTFYLPMENATAFDIRSEHIVRKLVQEIFPEDAGYDITKVVIAPFLESPADEDEPLHNAGSLGDGGPYEHDGLRFRSKTEIRVYDELKTRDILFFANATALLGNTDTKREPDFLICQAGKWGILEVMGDQYHHGANAMKDHDRARLFKRYGLFFIEFYDARRCYNDTEAVVTEFLDGLARS